MVMADEEGLERVAVVESASGTETETRMSRSFLTFFERWRKYQEMDRDRRDIYDVIWLVTGWY